MDSTITPRFVPAWKDRKAWIISSVFLGASALITFLGAWSSSTWTNLLLWTFIPLVVLASLAERFRWLLWVQRILLGISALLILGFAFLVALEGQQLTTILLMVTTPFVLLPVIYPVRKWIAKFIPINPSSPTHEITLSFIVLMVFYWFLSGIPAVSSTTSSTASSVASAFSQLAPLDPIRGELPFLALAFLGCGLLIRRNFHDTRIRLGLVKPTTFQIVIALVTAELLILIAVGASWISVALTPHINSQLNTISDQLYKGLGQNPWPWIGLALSAGICEETLFRGALQPRLGIWLTAILFASVHLQYEISFISLAIFMAAIAFGLLRKYFNTTTAIIAHAAYDLTTSFGLLYMIVLGGLALQGIVFLIGLGILVIFFPNKTKQALAYLRKNLHLASKPL